MPGGSRLKVKVHVDDRAGRRPARLKLSTAIIRRIAIAALDAEGVRAGELSIVVTRDPEIRALNARFRGKDKATNVLSFPQDDPRSPGAAVPLIGDVVISLDYVDRQGAETGSGFRYTFLYYLVHGILHLLGHDHHAPAEARRMYRRTREILAAAGEDRAPRARRATKR
jgi:probable rRNA maturation factor